MKEEKTPNDNAPQITEEDMLRLAREANNIQRQLPNELTICGKKWKLRPISMKQSLEISNLAFDAVAIQEEVQKEGLSARKMKRLNAKLHKLAAKMAANYVLGRRLRWIPFAYAYMWRKIYNQSEEVSATINSEQTLRGKDKDFYLANLENLKFQLVLSMRQVGEAAEEMRKRKESADSMLGEDALPKKEEGNKSGVHSKRPRTTKR